MILVHYSYLHSEPLCLIRLYKGPTGLSGCLASHKVHDPPHHEMQYPAPIQLREFGIRVGSGVLLLLLDYIFIQIQSLVDLEH